MNLKLKIRVQNCRNIEKKCDAIFENVIEHIMNINVVMILYVIGIIICDLIYHLKEFKRALIDAFAFKVEEWFCSPTY
jgi:hypothetical protein